MRLACAVALAFALAGTALAATGDPWRQAQAGLTYPVYKPTFTAAQKLVSVQRIPCTAGMEQSVFASFGLGSAPMRFSRERGFMLGEGYPELCSDFGDAFREGTRTVNGVRAEVFVYCNPPGKKCAFADGVKLGYVVRWHQPVPKSGTLRKRTLITLITSRLTFAEALRIAASLRPVR